MYNTKPNVERAERNLSPMEGFEPMVVKDGIGYVHGFAVCIRNFEAVEEKRRADYAATSRDARYPLPIWC